jgi:hypothetical protein
MPWAATGALAVACRVLEWPFSPALRANWFQPDAPKGQAHGHPPSRSFPPWPTRQLLADLVAAFRETASLEIQVESVGGVDAARRVAAGEAVDIVALASNAIEQMADSGRIVAGSRVDLVRSGVAVAVRAGAPRPRHRLGRSRQTRRAGSDQLSYSTGPSGVQLARLFERWGIADRIRERIVQATAGRAGRPARGRRQGCAGLPASSAK